MSAEAVRCRVVFDCNILLQALAFPTGPAARCLRLVERGRVELLFSGSTLAELSAVLADEEVRRISPRLTPTAISAFLEKLTFRATRVRRVPHVIQLPRDPDDEPYLDLAVAGKALYLVTRDKDLLSLETDYSQVGKRYRQKSHPLQIINPSGFLKLFDSDKE